MEFIAVLFGLGIVVLIGWVLVTIVRAVLKPSLRGTRSYSDDLDGMNEGDYHNGPGGYTGASAYPDSYYGDHEDEERH